MASRFLRAAHSLACPVHSAFVLGAIIRPPLRTADTTTLSERKTPPSGWPGQVKALDGVSPQPQDRQRLACLLQLCLVAVLNFACNYAPLNAQRSANRVSQLRCVLILLIFFVGICSRRDLG